MVRDIVSLQDGRVPVVFALYLTHSHHAEESLFDRTVTDSQSSYSGRLGGSTRNDHGSSLLDICVESLKIEIGNVDSAILDAVRRQSRSGSNARERLLKAQKTIQQVMSEVSVCRKMAEESEQMAQDICIDVRQLDNAKKNLTTAIYALRRLSMLVEGVDQLQVAAEKRNFRDAGNLLGAVKQLQSHFTSYTHIAKVAEVKGRVQALEQSLRLASLREFELLGEDPPPPHVVQVLKDCCAVTSAIGTTARDELVDIICRREMNMYTQIFGTVGETAKLERTVNRYKWFIRRLESRRMIWSIFPEEWRVTQLLALKYCSITKSELAEILSDADPEILAKDVDGLLKAVEATNVFEAEMSRRFSEQDDVQLEDGNDDDGDNGFFSYNKDSSDKDDLSTSDAIRRKYQQRRLGQASTTPDAALQKEEKRILMEGAAEAAVKYASFKNAISPVFEPYMFLYTDDVLQTLSRKLESSVVNEKWVQMSDDQMILKSSDDLTSMIREELRHCSSKISKREPLVELGKTFQKLYETYAAALISKIPKTSGGEMAGVATIGSTSWHIKVSQEDIRIICLIIRTSDHCISMVQQLENAIEKYVDSDFKGRVDLSGAEDGFNNAVTFALSALLLGVETQLDIPLSVLMRHNWEAFDITGDQSDFASQACSIISDTGRRIRPPNLSQNYFTFFCDKLVRSFAPRLFDAVFRCGPIRQAGGQQLRLDLEALRSAFVSMAKEGSFLGSRQGSPSKHLESNDTTVGLKSGDAWLESYSRDVASAFKVTESVLKVVSSPLETVVETILELMPGASKTDLQHILELMGIKKADMVKVLEEFGRKSKQAAESPRKGSTRSKPLPAPVFGMGMNTNSFSLPPAAAAKASAAAQDMASHISRIKSTANAQAAKFSAAMKSQSNLRFN